MMTLKTRPAGQPLIVLIAVLVVWVGIRASLWQPPWSLALETETYLLAVAGAQMDQSKVAAAGVRVRVIPARRNAGVSEKSTERPILRPDRFPLIIPVPPHTVSRLTSKIEAETAKAREANGVIPGDIPQQWNVTNDGFRAPSAPTHKTPARSSPTKRWSGDAWLLLREGRGQVVPASSAAGPLPASYGASQAGAVVRFTLNPDAAMRPAVYIRASKALIEGGESEGALGGSFRPMPDLPITAHAEARVARVDGETRIRPAAFVTTGIDAMPLPLGARLRGYAQAGYVGGRDATPFVDGQAVIDRSVLASDVGGTFNLGAGAWGGAQKGAERLDIGPSVSLSGQVGAVPLRLSVDYRMRVAGQAAPDSGAVLTLSTGF